MFARLFHALAIAILFYTIIFDNITLASSSIPHLEGSISGPAKPEQVSLESLSVEWDEKKLKLSIKDTLLGNTYLWQSVEGKPFFQAYKQAYQPSATSHGSIIMKNHMPKKSCQNQKITKIFASEGKIQVAMRLSGKGCEGHYHLSIFRKLGSIAIELKPYGEISSNFNHLLLSFATPQKEKIFGFGEQFTHLNLKGHSFPIIAQEQGHGRGNPENNLTRIMNLVAYPSGGTPYTSYAPMPLFISDSLRGFHLENNEFSFFDLSKPTEIRTLVYSDQINAVVHKKKTFLDLVEQMTLFTGRMKELPEWVHEGAILGGFLQGESHVNDLLHFASSKNIALSSIWIEDWCGIRDFGRFLGLRLKWNWAVDRSLYPNWDSLIKRIKSRGYKVIGYINPFLSNISEDPHPEDQLYPIAKERGFLVSSRKGGRLPIKMGGFSGHYIDLTNPEAFKWVKEIIKTNLIGSGLDGWMADFGESLAPESFLYNQMDGLAYRNQYTVDWARANQEAVAESGQGEGLLYFLRAGHTHSPGLAKLFWTGDQLTTWDQYDGLHSSLIGLLSSGISGMSLNHSDTGGLLSFNIPFLRITRDEELFIRWMQLNAFTSILRFHEGFRSRGGGTSNFQMLQASPMAIELISRYTHIYKQLKPYRMGLVNQAANKGYPVVRPLFFHFPDDKVTYELNDQFMLGPDLLVAPILKEGSLNRRVYLPAGCWRDGWDNSELNITSGQWLDRESPLDLIPVYVRCESNINLQI